MKFVGYRPVEDDEGHLLLAKFVRCPECGGDILTKVNETTGEAENIEGCHQHN